MKALVDEAIKQISLEGRLGCSMQRLWKLLEEELPINGCEKLTQRIKGIIWRSLVNLYSEDFSIYVSREAVAASRVSFDSEQSGISPKEPFLNAKVLIAMDDTCVKDPSLLQQVDALLIAVEECRYHFLGIRDAVTCRFQLSEKQFEALEQIGKSKRRGCLQSDLARSVGVEHKNFFFIMKQLEGRQLVVRNPVVMDRSDVDSHVSATNIIHLTAFAPDVKLELFQAFKMMTDSDDDRGDDNDKEARSYRMRDDASMMRQIIEMISESKDGVVLEYNVKQSLGFRLKKGHRTWRRLKKKMTDLQLIKSFVASVDGRESVCLAAVEKVSSLTQQRLAPLRLFEKDFDKWIEKCKVQERERAMRGPESSILADTSLNRQLYRMIVEAGPLGINTKELFGRLRLNSKRNMNRLKAIKETYGIEIHAEACGKSSTNRCFAPVSALTQQSTFVENKLASEATFGVVDCDADPEDNDQLCTDVDVIPLPAYPDPDDAAQKKLQSYLFSHLVSGRSEFRCQKLYGHIKEHGFLIRAHAGAFLRELENTHGLHSIGHGPDKKTIDRVVQRLISEDKIKKLKVSMWTKSGAQPKLVDVLFLKDFEVTEDALRRVCEHDQEAAIASRRRSHIKAQITQDPDQELPVFNDLTRLPRQPPRRHGQQDPFAKQAMISQQLHKNGFVYARMIRAKLLHFHVCELVGLGGHKQLLTTSSPSEPGFPSVLDKVQETSNLSIPHHNDPEGKTYRFASRSRDTIKQEHGQEITEEKQQTATLRYSFTPRELWDYMPTDVYLQVIGCSKKSDDISTLKESHQRMGELPQEKVKLLIDRHSRNRLADTLNTLSRLRLIEGSVGSSETGVGLLESCRFVAHTTGILEIPEGTGEDDQTQRRVECALETAEGLEMYWSQMEYVFTRETKPVGSCFPATVLSEICAVNNWSSSKTLPTYVWLTIQELMNDMDPLNWKKCREIAKKMNVDYHEVIRISRDRDRKKMVQTREKQQPTSSKRTKRRSFKTPTPKKSKKRNSRSDPNRTTCEIDLKQWIAGVPKDEPPRTGYWYKNEDIALLSGYYAWLTSSRAPKSGARWTEMIGLPGSSTTTALDRCKRRLRYLQKQSHLRKLFTDLEATTRNLYQQRWRRVMKTDDTIPASASSEEETEKGEAKSMELAREGHLETSSSALIGMQAFRLDPFEIHEQCGNMTALEIMLQRCDAEDKELIETMKRLVLEIAEHGPRTPNREIDSSTASLTGTKQYSIPDFVDFDERRVQKRSCRKESDVPFEQERLYLAEEPQTLAISMAKDFLVSCIYELGTNKHKAEEIMNEVNKRFKEEEIVQAANLLIDKGWVNPDRKRKTADLPPVVRRRLMPLWFPKEEFEHAYNEMQCFSDDDDWESREYDVSTLSEGTLFAVLSAVMSGKVEFCAEDIDVLCEYDKRTLDNVPIRVRRRELKTSKRRKVQQKKEGVRRTLSELLRESELDDEMNVSAGDGCTSIAASFQPEQDIDARIQAIESDPMLSILLKAIRRSGSEGIGGVAVKHVVYEACEDWSIDVDKILTDWSIGGLVRSLEQPDGNIYLAKEHGDRYFLPNEASPAEIPIRPWIKHNGEIHVDFLAKMQKAVLSTVLQRPGVSEDRLIEVVGYCSAQSARELCRMMVRQGILIRQEIHPEPVSSPPPLFRSHTSEYDSQTLNVYHANLPTCFSRQLPVVD